MNIYHFSINNNRHLLFARTNLNVHTICLKKKKRKKKHELADINKLDLKVYHIWTFHWFSHYCLSEYIMPDVLSFFLIFVLVNTTGSIGDWKLRVRQDSFLGSLLLSEKKKQQNLVMKLVLT